MARFWENAIRARLDDHKISRPMFVTLYVNFGCNFRCTYCDDGTQTLYPDVPERGRMDTEGVVRVLEIMRRVAPGMNITGGEPTLRPDLSEIFAHLGRLRYAPVIFNTNAFLLDRHLDALDATDFLVVSLDATDRGRSDRLIDVGQGGQTARVLANLDLACAHREARGLGFMITISTVVMPETIEDAWDVWELCRERGFAWAPSPHMSGNYPNPGLVDHPGWVGLMDEVMRVKAAGGRVFGNDPSLRAMRDFSRFECYPLTRAVVHPNGDLLYPCGHLKLVAGNILETGDYDRALAIGQRAHGPVPRCDARCQLTCYSESSTAITHPEEAVREAWRFLTYTKKPPPLRRPPPGERPTPRTVAEVKALPSLPADEVRRLRREGRLLHDFSSRLQIASA
jgi:MoaA/NifB/PqqE/SkfB family radical SAM enzyme